MTVEIHPYKVQQVVDRLKAAFFFPKTDWECCQWEHKGCKYWQISIVHYNNDPHVANWVNDNFEDDPVRELTANVGWLEFVRMAGLIIEKMLGDDNMHHVMVDWDAIDSKNAKFTMFTINPEADFDDYRDGSIKRYLSGDELSDAVRRWYEFTERKVKDELSEPVQPQPQRGMQKRKATRRK